MNIDNIWQKIELRTSVCVIKHFYKYAIWIVKIRKLRKDLKIWAYSEIEEDEKCNASVTKLWDFWLQYIAVERGTISFLTL